MLMLVLEMLRKKKQCIAIIYYKCKLSLFGRDDTKQAKSLIFIVVPKTEQVPKVKKKQKKTKLKEMLLEPSFLMESERNNNNDNNDNNNSNYKLI